MKSRFSKIFPAILLMGLLVSCAPPYHQKDERYIFVAFNTNLPYWQEAAAGLEDSAKQLGVKATSREEWIKLDGEAEAIERAPNPFSCMR